MQTHLEGRMGQARVGAKLTKTAYLTNRYGGQWTYNRSTASWDSEDGRNVRQVITDVDGGDGLIHQVPAYYLYEEGKTPERVSFSFMESRSNRRILQAPKKPTERPARMSSLGRPSRRKTGGWSG